MPETQQHNKGKEAKPGVVIEMGESDAPDKHSTTGEDVRSSVRPQEVQVDRERLADLLEEDGKFAQAARVRGQSYAPDFSTKAVHTLIQMKNATITVLLAAATPLALILVWEGIRLVIPRARTLPGFIKYKAPEMKDVKPVRLSAAR